MSANSARDIARQSPGRETWRRLVAALDELSVDDVLSVESELADALARWPDRTRVRPRRWGIEVRGRKVALRKTPHRGWPLGRALHLGAIVSPETASALARWRPLAGLGVMSLEGSTPGAELGDLLSSDALEGLHTLGLRRVHLENAGTGWLRASALTSIERLDMAEATLGADALEALTSTPMMRLERLHLGNAPRPQRALAKLLRDAEWPRLKRLNIHGARFDGKLARAVARNASLAGIERLTIGTLDGDDATLDLDAIEALVDGDRQPRLERLTVRGMKLDESTARALLKVTSGIGELVVRDCELPSRIADRWRRGHVDGPNVRVR